MLMEKQWMKTEKLIIAQTEKTFSRDENKLFITGKKSTNFYFYNNYIQSCGSGFALIQTFYISASGFVMTW